MTTYIIPPEYVGLRDVERRAYSTWGDDASGRLKYLLVSGGLSVWRVDESANLHEIEQGFWRSSEADGVIKYDEFRSSDQRRPIGRPLFRVAEVDRELPIPTLPTRQRSSPDVAATKAKGKGGRPPVYSELDFVIEAAALMYETQKPFKQVSGLRAAALDAYSQTLPAGIDPPSDEWARPLINKLWERFTSKA